MNTDVVFLSLEETTNRKKRHSDNGLTVGRDQDAVFNLLHMQRWTDGSYEENFFKETLPLERKLSETTTKAFVWLKRSLFFRLEEELSQQMS